MKIMESLQRRMPGSLKPLPFMGFQVYQYLRRKTALLFQRKTVKLAKLKKAKSLKLNIGCGRVKLNGWVGIDIEPGADWKNQDWLTWPEHEFIKTRGQMINISFRWWGHKYLYNGEDLTNQLVNTGFQHPKPCDWAKSDHFELCGLETREDSKLIMEAEKQ